MATISTSIHHKKMEDLIEFAQNTNEIWPFAALISDQSGRTLVKAADCAHISPLYHAESLAIHVLAKNEVRNLEHLTLYCTGEPDLSSLISLYWARITHELKFDQIVYGTSCKTIYELLPFNLNMTLDQNQRISDGLELKMIKGLAEKECDILFKKAKERQIQLNIPHPARLLSKCVENFFLFEKRSSRLYES